jgi:hypothetical protein
VVVGRATSWETTREVEGRGYVSGTEQVGVVGVDLGPFWALGFGVPKSSQPVPSRPQGPRPDQILFADIPVTVSIQVMERVADA